VAAAPAEAVATAGTSGATTAATPAPFEHLLGVAAAGAGAFLPLVYSPIAASETFTPKYALLVLLAAVGLVPLCRLAIGSRYVWPARFGIAFILVAMISAALSPSKLVGFFGLYLWGEGAVFLTGLIAAWAIGVCLGPVTRRWLYVGLLVGAAGNAVAAVLQTTLQLNTQAADLSGFGLFGGTQADGMMGSPIHLEAILLGALALVLGRACLSSYPRSLGYGALVALFSAALEFSSERLAVLVLIGLGTYAVVAYRRRSLLYLGSIALGFGAALLGGGGNSLAQRVAASSASTTYGLRVHGALDAVLATLRHQPLLGFGPGEQRNALYLYQPLSLAKSLGPGRSFTDVHDLPANILVMTGVVGFVLFAAFFAGGAWRARGAFAGYAAASLAVSLAEPMNVGVTPLAFLALGAALASSCGSPWTGPARAPRRPATALAGGLALLALVPAVLMLASDILDHSAQMHFSLTDAKTADALLPIWPQTAQELIEIYNYESLVDRPASRADTVASVQWAVRAADRDPSDGEEWVVVGEGYLALHDLSAARAAAQRAIADYPLGTAALELLGLLDADRGDWSGAIAAFRTAASVAPTSQQIKGWLNAAEAHNSSYFQVGTTP
jgi:tetratricopeptide (TPR) repeat protein